MKRLARWLRRIAEWLDPLHDPILLARAKELVEKWEKELGPGFGEAKRHQVYAKLLKEFPAIAKRVISATIEEALK